MASKFRKVDPRFWKDERGRALTPIEKLVALYVFTAQANRIGCFSFSPGMAAEDLGIPLNTCRTHVRDVCRTLFWRWDEEAGVIYLPTWWKSCRRALHSGAWCFGKTRSPQANAGGH
jgi:hypothetical protein